MIGIAIGILWLCIGILAVGVMIFAVFYCIKLWTPIPDKIEKVVWLIFLILCLIYLLSALAGGGLPHPRSLR